MPEEPDKPHKPGGAPAARQLVLCFDGTGDTLTAHRSDTNVLQLLEWLSTQPAPLPRLLYYDPGVGAPADAPPTGPLDWLSRQSRQLAALALGSGIYDNISQAYLFLMRNWQPQDQIVLFGFSRGAFTARAVAGLVQLFGVLRPEHEVMLPTLLHIYFARRDDDDGGRHLLGRAVRRMAPGLWRHSRRQELAEQVRTDFASPEGRQAWVHFVGVWDTVDSVGLPGLLSRRISSSATLFDKRMRHARQALALDEHRAGFLPRLYDDSHFKDGAGPGGRTLRQAWFPGAHSDVGGGYAMAQAGLAQRALAWMQQEAAPLLGLQPPPTPPAATPAAPEPLPRHDPLFDQPWWALAGMLVRQTQQQNQLGHTIAIGWQPAPVPPASPWRQRRPLGPVLWALGLGLALLLLQGLQLLPAAEPAWTLRTACDALAATSALAAAQLATLWGAGLRQALPPGGAPALAWAMVFDLAFIPCWGYLLARIASRSFAWLAGAQRPGAAPPRWGWLGMAPLVAVGGDVAEDLSTLALLALQDMGAEHGAWLAGILMGLCALAKLLALLACGFWVVLRLTLVFRAR